MASLLYLFVVLCSCGLAVGQEERVRNEYDYLCKGPGLVVMPKSDCRKFVSCHDVDDSNGDQKCAPGTRFDSGKQRCLNEDEVRCSEQPGRNFNPDTQRIQNADTGCFDGPIPGNCNKFIRCQDGLRIDDECGEGTVLNPRTFACTHPEDLDERDKLYCGI